MSNARTIDTERLNVALKEFADYMEARYKYFSDRRASGTRGEIDPKFRSSQDVMEYRTNIALLVHGAPTMEQLLPEDEDAAILQDEVISACTADWNDNSSTYWTDILKGDVLKDNVDAQRILHTQNKFVVFNTPGPVRLGLITAFGEVAGLLGAEKLRREVRAIRSEARQARHELGLK